MFCEHCGQPNEEGAKFCEFCGKKIEKEPRSGENREIHTSNDSYRPVHEQNYGYKNQESSSQVKNHDKDLRSYGLIGFFILVVLFIVVYFGFIKDKDEPLASNRQDRQEESLGQNSVGSKVSYEDQWMRLVEDGMSYIENGNDFDGVKLLASVPEDSGRAYTKAQSAIDSVEDSYIKEVKELANNGSYEDAYELAEFYMMDFPDFTKLMDLRDELELKKEEGLKVEEDKRKAEEQKRAKEERKAEEARAEENPQKTSSGYDLEELRRNNSYGQNGNPEYTEVYSPDFFLNHNFPLDTDVGLVRSSPDLNAPIVYKINRGEVVYVEDVYDDGERFWVDVGGGWISAKLLTGEYR